MRACPKDWGDLKTPRACTRWQVVRIQCCDTVTASKRLPAALRDLSALQLIHHFVALLDRLVRELLRRVLAPERLQLTVRHLRVLRAEQALKSLLEG